MSRKPKSDPSAGADSSALHAVIEAMMEAEGRGSLTTMTEKLGMASPSATRKRLLRPEKAFDEPTMRAVLLVAGSRADDLSPEFMITHRILSRTEVNGYEIQIRDVNGIPTTFWRSIE